MQKVKLIYNPFAGRKRKLVPKASTAITLEHISDLLEQYQITADFVPTEYPGHATILAKQAQKEGYKLVLVAGGDGTAGEVANGLANSDITLGIIPLGSFMNIARMLSIPQDVEKAIQIIKIGRTRKIDLGSITKLSGENLDQPYFFVESAGLGMEAQLHQDISDLEKGNISGFFRLFKTVSDYYVHKAHLTIDQRKMTVKTSMITISNGPYSATALPLAPKAKLNDHKLTLTLYRLSNWELIQFFLSLLIFRKSNQKKGKIETHQGKRIKIETTPPIMVHVDARVFATTPVEFKINPNALNVITGFPKKEDSSLLKRTFLDP